MRKYLIAVLSLFFIVSTIFLFWQNERGLDPNYNKSWWTLSFATPREPTNLSFTIENHSDQNNFRYKIIANKEILTEETFEIKRGETKTIFPSVIAVPNIRTFVIVESGKEKKEIYR